MSQHVSLSTKVTHSFFSCPINVHQTDGSGFCLCGIGIGGLGGSSHHIVWRIVPSHSLAIAPVGGLGFIVPHEMFEPSFLVLDSGGNFLRFAHACGDLVSVEDPSYDGGGEPLIVLDDQGLLIESHSDGDFIEFIVILVNGMSTLAYF